MTKKFASQADLEVKKTTFAQLSAHCWAYTAEGDPNTGVIITDDAVLICDALATPVMAQSLIAEIRKITDKPIKYVVLSHYHAVRVLGASGYKAEGMQEIIASQGTYEMIVERGAQDMQSEYERFPRLFNAFDSIPGLTWPTLVFQGADDALFVWARGQNHACRPRPHQGRHGGLGAIGKSAVLGRPDGSRCRLLHRRCTARRMARHA
jgi:hypothetical protein